MKNALLFVMIFQLASCAGFRERNAYNTPDSVIKLSKVPTVAVSYYFENGKKIYDNENLEINKNWDEKSAESYSNLIKEHFLNLNIVHFKNCNQLDAKYFPCIVLLISSKYNSKKLIYMLLTLGIFPYIDNKQIVTKLSLVKQKGGENQEVIQLEENLLVLGGIYFIPFFWLKLPGNIQNDIRTEQIIKASQLIKY